MRLIVLGSSSKGNCYLLAGRSEVLIIEAGVKFASVKKALGYDLRKVAGCLVSHQHADHAKYIQDIVECGIPTLALKDVWQAKGIRDSRAVECNSCALYTFGGFRVKAFPVCHDVPCVGFFIEHAECGRIVFITDTRSCDYDFPGLRTVMIEANYSHECLTRSMDKGITNPSQGVRTMETHMSLSGCEEWLRSQDLSGVETVVLLHLSDKNSDERQFVSRIEGATGKCVYAANQGMEIEL